MLLKPSASGSVEWRRTYGDSADEEAHAVAPLPDGYAPAGPSTCGAGGNDVLVMAMDSLGNPVWALAAGRKPALWPPRRMVVTGNTMSYGAGGRDVPVIKLDSLGNGEWVRSYGDPEGEGAYWGIQEACGLAPSRRAPPLWQNPPFSPETARVSLPVTIYSPDGRVLQRRRLRAGRNLVKMSRGLHLWRVGVGLVLREALAL